MRNLSTLGNIEFILWFSHRLLNKTRDHWSSEEAIERRFVNKYLDISRILYFLARARFARTEIPLSGQLTDFVSTWYRLGTDGCASKRVWNHWEAGGLGRSSADKKQELTHGCSSTVMRRGERSRLVMKGGSGREGRNETEGPYRPGEPRGGINPGPTHLLLLPCLEVSFVDIGRCESCLILRSLQLDYMYSRTFFEIANRVLS